MKKDAWEPHCLGTQVVPPPLMMRWEAQAGEGWDQFRYAPGSIIDIHRIEALPPQRLYNCYRCPL